MRILDGLAETSVYESKCSRKKEIIPTLCIDKREPKNEENAHKTFHLVYTRTGYRCPFVTIYKKHSSLDESWHFSEDIRAQEEEEEERRKRSGK